MPFYFTTDCQCANHCAATIRNRTAIVSAKLNTTTKCSHDVRLTWRIRGYADHSGPVAPVVVIRRLIRRLFRASAAPRPVRPWRGNGGYRYRGGFLGRTGVGWGKRVYER